MSLRLSEEDKDSEEQIFTEMAEDLHEYQVLEEQGQLLKPIKKDIIKKRAIARMSFVMAKAASDPDYMKYRDLIMRARPYKQKILTKYAPKAKSKVRIK
jgi:hypothetical protein